MSRRTWARLIGIGLVAIPMLVWPQIAGALPDLDALLAPSGADGVALVVTLLLIAGRALYVVLAPALAAALLLDAALGPTAGPRTPPPDSRVSEAPCDSSPSS